MHFGMLAERERRTVDILYNRKEGNILTGADIKQLYVAISP